jgi:hypothetical protein
MVTSISTGAAHCPWLGVNVYVPALVLLTVAGSQAPVILFEDVVGNTGGVELRQMTSGISNTGVIELVIVTVVVFVKVGQPPEAGMV